MTRLSTLVILLALAGCASDTAMDAADPTAGNSAAVATILLSAPEICFTPILDGPAPRPDDVRVTSSDGSVLQGLTATITYAAGQSAGWLTTRFDQASTPARLWLTASHGALAPGEYNATVTVEAPGVAPASFAVTMTVSRTNPSIESLLHIAVQWEGEEGLGFIDIKGNGGIFCRGGPIGCTGFLPAGTGTLAMSANGEVGARFIRWEGACTGTSPLCSVTFTAPGTEQFVTAVVGTRPSTFSLGMQGPGAAGTVTVTNVTRPDGSPVVCVWDAATAPQPIGSCGGGETAPNAPNTTVTLTAVPGPGSVFAGWQVGVSPPSGAPEPPNCEPTVPTCTLVLAAGGSQIGGLVTFAPVPP